MSPIEAFTHMEDLLTQLNLRDPHFDEPLEGLEVLTVLPPKEVDQLISWGEKMISGEMSPEEYVSHVNEWIYQMRRHSFLMKIDSILSPRKTIAEEKKSGQDFFSNPRDRFF